MLPSHRPYRCSSLKNIILFYHCQIRLSGSFCWLLKFNMLIYLHSHSISSLLLFSKTIYAGIGVVNPNTFRYYVALSAAVNQ